jgi:hypothetical protein
MEKLAGEIAITNPDEYSDNAINLYKSMDSKERKAVDNFIMEYSGVSIDFYIKGEDKRLWSSGDKK